MFLREYRSRDKEVRNEGVGLNSKLSCVGLVSTSKKKMDNFIQYWLSSAFRVCITVLYHSTWSFNCRDAESFREREIVNI